MSGTIWRVRCINTVLSLPKDDARTILSLNLICCSWINLKAFLTLSHNGASRSEKNSFRLVWYHSFVRSQGFKIRFHPETTNTSRPFRTNQWLRLVPRSGTTNHIRLLCPMAYDYSEFLPFDSPSIQFYDSVFPAITSHWFSRSPCTWSCKCSNLISSLSRRFSRLVIFVFFLWGRNFLRYFHNNIGMGLSCSDKMRYLLHIGNFHKDDVLLVYDYGQMLDFERFLSFNFTPIRWVSGIRYFHDFYGNHPSYRIL